MVIKGDTRSVDYSTYHQGIVERGFVSRGSYCGVPSGEG